MSVIVDETKVGSTSGDQGPQGPPGPAGAVNNVTATSPIASSGGATPDISLSGTVGIDHGGTGQTTANTALNALLPTQTSNNGKALVTDGTNTSWTTISGGGGTVTDVTASSPLASSGGATPNLTIQDADSTHTGALTSTDWNTFNNKQPAGSYAITSLNNLATTSINQDLIPAADGVQVLGSPSKRWGASEILGIIDASSTLVADFSARRLHNASGAILLEFSGSNLDAQNLKIANVADPAADQDVATKAYVDANSGGNGTATQYDPGTYEVADGGTLPSVHSYYQLTIAPSDPGVSSSGQAVTVADVAGSLNNTYFQYSAWLSDSTDPITGKQVGTNYYFWYNVNSLGTDPNPGDLINQGNVTGGTVGIEVDIALNATAGDVADATAAAAATYSSIFTVTHTLTTDTIIFTTVAKGAGDNVTDTNNTGFTLTNVTTGTDPTYSDITLSTTASIQAGTTIGQIVIYDIFDNIFATGSKITIPNNFPDNTVWGYGTDYQLDPNATASHSYLTMAFVWMGPFWRIQNIFRSNL